MPATVSITRPTFVDTDTLSASAFNAVAASSASVPDAESAVLGVIKLAGDLGGTAAAPTVLKGSFTNGELKVRDVGGDSFLKLATGSTLTADRTLTVTTGDADRTITLSGNPTLNDWFDQGVKSTSSPTFATVYATAASGTVQFFAGDQEETGERAQLYAVTDTYSALNLYSKNNKLVVQIDTLGESNTSGRVNVGDAAGIWGSLSVNGSQGLLTLYAVGNTVTLSGAGLDACPIGQTTAAAAKFTGVTITNTTNSTSATTGALVVAGGIGLGGTLVATGVIGTGAINFNPLVNNGIDGVYLDPVSGLTASSTHPTLYLRRRLSDGNLAQFYTDDDVVGGIALTGSGTAVAYNTSSDRRLKTHIRDYTASGPVIDGIRPRLFDWRTGQKDSVGLIAQEVHPIAPYAVMKGDDDPDTIHQQWQVDYSKLVPVIIAEVKSLRARVSTLEALTNL
jgi:hypothetical protein